MGEKTLKRSEKQINRDDYKRLFELHKVYKWLENEPEALFELWCMCDSEDQKKLIEMLIPNFLHLTSTDLLKIGKEISNHIENNWNLTANNTFLVATCDDEKPDGSQAFIQSLKNKFSSSWKEHNFFNSLLDGAHKIENKSIIILVDDFIGTGDTITRKVTYLKNKMSERKIENYSIKVISLAGMEFSKEALDKLDIEYFSYYWLKKGISELVPPQYKTVSLQSMEELEDKLLKKYRKRRLPKFGYKESETLFALESQNIPNNVFPIFWWPYLNDKSERTTFFKRI